MKAHIFGQEFGGVEQEQNAEWLKDLEGEMLVIMQDNITITTEMVIAKVKKMPNWKSPGPDGVQGFWLKNLVSLHDRIANQINDMINKGETIPAWLTTGRTVLCQKDPQRGSAVDNFRPISCLPLMWKLITGINSDCIYAFLEENKILLVEQKGCRRKSHGTEDQLLNDKTVVEDSKHKHKNTAMAWVDYKKAYDMVPHSWIIEILELAQVAPNVIDFAERSMNSWNTELTTCGETLGTMKIKRGIFHGDSLSPLLFLVCMIPLTEILRKAKAGYILDDIKVNHLLSMDDLKLFEWNLG